MIYFQFDRRNLFMATKNEKGNNEKNILDKLSFILAIVAIVVSLIGIYTQNRISLFEKRFELYQSYLSLTLNAEAIDKNINNIDVNEKESLYIAIAVFLVPEADVQQLEFFDDYLDEEEKRKTITYIIKNINKKCVELDGAKYVLNLSKSDISKIDEIENILKSFAANGYNMPIEDIRNMLETIGTIDFLTDMESQLYIGCKK